MYNDVATLINKVNTGTVDSNGDVVYNEVETDIFVEIKSVGMKEFYTGQQAGYNPSIKFEIADYEDYSNQPFVKYNNEVYKVIRTYRTGTILEIVCEHYEG